MAGGLIHKQAMESANHWQALISVLIRQADAEDEKVEGAPVPESAPDRSIANQIRELGDLRDDGLLTAEEFEVQKAKLLGS